MSLVDDINAAITGAMKSRDQAKLGPLRMLKAALVNRRVEAGRALEDRDVQHVVATLIKQRRDAIEQFTAGGRNDLATKEAAEIVVLERYLPPPADPAFIESAVDAAIAETGATSPGDLGKVMKVAMATLSGRSVDGKLVNELVRRKLAKTL